MLFLSWQVLLSTTQLYYYFFHKSPQMQLKRALMVLAASLEYEKSHNSEVIERQSDNIEVPQVIFNYRLTLNLNKHNLILHQFVLVDKAAALLEWKEQGASIMLLLFY